MSESIDVYIDQFQINTGPFGCTLNFSVTAPTPPAPGAVPQSEHLATVRTSLEHLKVMAFIMRRQVLQHESKAGVRIEVPIEVLNAIGIGSEDWDSFWRQT